MNPRIPLADQLAELRREMRGRKYRYPRLVMEQRMSAAEADKWMERLQACIVTLEWLARNEARIRAAPDDLPPRIQQDRSEYR